MKLLKLALIITTLSVIFVCAIQQNVFASGMSDIMGQAGEFIRRGGNGKLSQTQIEKDLQPVGNILFGIAITVLLVVGSILGVKYMISGADERADIKQKLIWYVVAAVLIFSAAGVYNLVYGIITSAIG